MGTKVARRAAAPGSGPEQAQPARATDEKEKTRTPRRSKTAPKEEEAAEVTAQVAAAAALENPLPRSACGGSFSKKAPVFSTDGRCLFCMSAYSVRVYSVATGTLMQTLPGFADATILTVAHNPANAFQLFVVYKDGRISLWDFNDGVVLKTVDANQPIRHFALLESGDEAVIVTPNAQRDKRAATSDHERSNWRVYHVSFKPSLQMRFIARLRDVEAFAVDTSGRLMAAVAKRSLYVIRAVGPDFEVVSVKHSTALHVVAVNASEGCIAAGDASGCINLWYLPSGGDAIVAPTAFHWHSSALNSLAFSPDGTHMISGGEEGVLVIWQLATRARNFLPRLGAPIISLSASLDGSMYALGMGDSSVRLVETLGLVTRHTIVGVRQVQPGNGALDFSHGIVLDPKRRAIVLNGLPGGIQFFSPSQDRLLLDVDVLHRNLVTRAQHGAVNFPRIEHVAFSRDGAWMATIDHFEEPGMPLEITLRFWRYDESAQTYVLNTRVDMPHSQRVNSLVFHPRLPLVVTAGHDKRFRLWHTETLARKDEAPVTAWACRSIGFHREMVLRDAAFSEDGSLLAVACGQLITLWDPLSNTLQGTLCHSPPDRPVLQLAFLRNSPYLVARTRSHIYVWSLLSCEVWWSAPIEARQFVPHPTRASFLVIKKAVAESQVSEIVQFDAASASPVASWQVSGPLIRSALYIDDSHFALVDDAQHIFVAHPHTSSFTPFPSAALSKDAVAAADKPGLLGRLFARPATTSSPDSTPDSIPDSRPLSVPSSLPAHAALDAPAHAIPALTRLFDAYMQTLLSPPLAASITAEIADEAANQNAALVSNESSDEDEDEDEMQVDVPVANGVHVVAAQSSKGADMNFAFLVDVFSGRGESEKAGKVTEKAEKVTEKAEKAEKVAEKVPKTPSKALKTPLKQVEKVPKTPAKETKTPGKQPKTPGKETKTPSKEAKTPSTSKVSRVKTPARHVNGSNGSMEVDE